MKIPTSRFGHFGFQTSSGNHLNRLEYGSHHDVRRSIFCSHARRVRPGVCLPHVQRIEVRISYPQPPVHTHTPRNDWAERIMAIGMAVSWPIIAYKIIQQVSLRIREMPTLLTGVVSWALVAMIYMIILTVTAVTLWRSLAIIGRKSD